MIALMLLRLVVARQTTGQQVERSILRRGMIHNKSSHPPRLSPAQYSLNSATKHHSLLRPVLLCILCCISVTACQHPPRTMKLDTIHLIIDRTSCRHNSITFTYLSFFPSVVIFAQCFHDIHTIHPSCQQCCILTRHCGFDLIINELLYGTMSTFFPGYTVQYYNILRNRQASTVLVYAVFFKVVSTLKYPLDVCD